ncbi:MAG: InlB B-repeat-containing protein [Salinivirgaceae bacterium]|nr:InlB B-repeat-containing protein [Salinivirgaceae bacterium]
MVRRVLAMLCLMFAIVATAEAQNSFAYQAVIRNAKGELVSNQEVGMQFSLVYEGQVVYSETHKPTTNQYGNIQVNVGEGRKVSGSFATVPWSTMKVMMKIEVDPQGGTNYIDLGTIQLQPAPYAMYATEAGAVSTIQPGEPKSDGDALFEVKDKNGNVVFAVYPDGVRVFVDDADSTKAMRTGFAVAGRRAAKEGADADIFSVTADGTQVFVSEEDTAGGKAMRTGFAVSGRRAAKDLNSDLFTVSSTGTQIYINNEEDGDKAMRTGFAVAGRRAAKDDDKYLEINTDGTRVFIDDDSTENSGKAMRTGFAVAGRRAAKGDAGNKYMEISADGTQIYVGDDEKAMRTGFAVAGRRAAKGESLKLFEVNGYGTKIYIDATAGKAMRTGFAVAGRRAAKEGATNKYMVIDADGTRIYVDYEEAKAMRTGFAVAGRRAAKDDAPNTILTVDNVDGTRAYIDDIDGKAMRTGFAVSGRRAAKEGDDHAMQITDNKALLTVSKNLTLQDKGTEANLLVMTQEQTKIATEVFAFIETETNTSLIAADVGGVDVNADVVVAGDMTQTIETEENTDIEPVVMTAFNQIDTLGCDAVLEAKGYQLLKIYGSGMYYAPVQSVDADGNSYILFDAKGNISTMDKAVVAVVMTNAATPDAQVLVWPIRQTNSTNISFGLMAANSTDQYVKVVAAVNAREGVERKVEIQAENGSVEVSGNQVYGEIVSLEAKNAEGYHFAQWSDGNTINPRTTRFTGAIAFTALFYINTYNITVNPTEGGSVEGAGTYNYGYMATLKAIADEHYHFVSWNDGNTESERKIEVKADWELTPSFALDTFLVKFVNGSETLQSTYVKYGQKPVYEGKTPEKEADAENTYSFIGWSPEIAETTTVQGEQTYEAQFEAKERLNTVTITWIVDGARKETYWEAGEMPVYDKNGKLPTKAETEEFSYEFSHWDQEVVEATENAEYTAIFSEKKRTYAITFYDADGSLLKTVQVEYGTVPVYDENGNNPTKETDNYNSYVFSGWKEGELKSVTGTATYTAKYTSTPRIYTISTKVETIGSDKVGGSVSVEGDMTYGTTATLTAQPNDGYVFVYWGDNQENTESVRTVTIPDETTYTAVFAKVNKLTVKISQEGVGSVIVKDKDGKEIQLSEAEVSVATLDGSTPQPTEWYAFIVKGEKVTLEAVANDGFVFKYWNDDQSLTTATLNNVEISEDVEYTAIFEKNLTLKYELCGGSMVDPNKPTTLTGPSWQGFAFYTAEDVKREGYEFDGWYEIYNEGEYSNKVTALPEMLASSTLTLYAKWNEKIVSSYQVKSFSVAKGKTVKFSQGNLQYQGSTNTWRFAEHQYDAVDIDKLAFSCQFNYNTYLNDLTTNIGPDYAEWIDHFGWGSSGYNGVQPYTRDYSETVTVGGVTKTIHNLLHISGMTGDNAQYDWGVHNTISNGGDANWRTLTMDEWLYLVNSRENAASLRAPARVNGYAGLVLLPDDWTEAPQGITFNTTLNGTEYTAWATNEYDAQQWAKMESAGAVFLPASGMQDNYGVWQSASHNDSNGSTIYLYYWTASVDRVGYDTKGSIYTCLGSTGSTVASYYPSGGSYMPVRLVQDDPTEAHLYVDPEKSGDGLTAETALPSLAAALDEVKDGNLDWYIHVNGMLSSHVSQDVLGEISARSLTIEGSNPENDGFRATGENNAVMVIGPDNENFTVTLKNLKLTGGKNYSGDGEGALRIGKIYDDNNYVLKPTNVLLENVLITDNSVNNNTESPVGVGVYVHAGSKLTIGDGTQITGNTVGDAHVAVYNDGEIVMTGGMVGGNNGTDIFNNGSLTLNGQAVAGNVILTETGNKITLGSDFTATADTVAMIRPASYPDTDNPTVKVLECDNLTLLANVCGKFAVAPYQESQDDEPIYYLVNSNGNLEQGCAVLFMSDISSVNPISVAVLPVGSEISAPNTGVLTIPNGCEFDGWLRMEMDDATHMPTFSSIDFESYLVQATDDMILLCPEWTKTLYVDSDAEIGDGTSNNPFGSIEMAAYGGMTGMTTNYILKISGFIGQQQNLSGVVANSITLDGAPESGSDAGSLGWLQVYISTPVIVKNLTIDALTYEQDETYGDLTLGENAVITSNVGIRGGDKLTMLEGSQAACVYAEGNVVMHGGEVKGRDTNSDGVNDEYVYIADNGTFTMSGSAKPHQVKTSNKIMIDGQFTYNDNDDYITYIDYYDYELMLGQPVLERADGFEGDLPFNRFALANEGYEISDKGAVQKKENGTSDATTIWVGGENASDDYENSSQDYPFATIYKVSSFINEGNPNGSSETNYVIKVTGTIEEEGYLDIYEDKAATVRIEGTTSLVSGVPQDIINGLTIRTSEEEVTFTLKNIKITSTNVGLSVGDASDGNRPSHVILDSGVLIENCGADGGYTNGVVVVGNSTLEIKEGCVIRNNHGDQGSGMQVYNGSQLILYAGAVVDASNDVWLETGAIVTVAGLNEGTEKIATITPEEYDYAGALIGVSDGVSLSDACERFDVTRKDNNCYRIASDGILEKISCGGTSNNGGGMPEGFTKVDGGTIDRSYNVGWNDNDYEDDNMIIPSLLVCNHLVSQYEYEQLMTYYGAVKSEHSDLQPSETSEEAKKNTLAYYVSWIDAIIYCNLLSMAEHKDPVYSINDVTDPADEIWENWSVAQVEGKYYSNDISDGTGWDSDGGNFKFNFSANGYRLLTSAEFNYLLQHEHDLITNGNYNEWCNTYKYDSECRRVWYDGENDEVADGEDAKYNYTREQNMGFRVVRNAYIGSKKPGETLAVGDIVFNDGSSMPYSSTTSLSDAQKAAAVAVIFYQGTECSNDGSVRTLGVGLEQTSGVNWCSSDAYGSTNSFDAIKCVPNGSAGSYTFDESTDRDGSDNLEEIWQVLLDENNLQEVDKDEYYPAFYWAKRYSTDALLGSELTSGWYLPSGAELFYLTTKVDVVNSALEACGGTKFVSNGKYWTSSQSASNAANATLLVLMNLDNWQGLLTNTQKDGSGDSTNGGASFSVRAIRQF